jgi:murein DD-endopeptidase MepM/ murein hydrolase activator NlpD
MIDRIVKGLMLVLVIGYLAPRDKGDLFRPMGLMNWDSRSYWYYPWGNGRVHRGVDMFAAKGTPIFTPTYGIIISRGYGSIAGNYVYLLGPKWRIYYFAHLDSISTRSTFIASGKPLGLVGSTGNAEGKPPHLHLSVYTPFPYFWLYDNYAIEGWKKMFYLNPLIY